MNTKDYLELVRKKTQYNDYKIAQEFNINQSNLSKYSRGVATLSEAHAFLFAAVLNINPAQIIADTRLEKAEKKGEADKIKFWQQQTSRYSADNLCEPVIALAQINPTLGDLEANANKIITQTIKAKSMGADIIVFPELATVGYPPEDLLLMASFISQVADINNFIIQSIPSDIMIIFGSIHAENEKLYNVALVAKNQKHSHIYRKQILPNYGVFDEKRYFYPGNKPLIININHTNIAILICEDIWSATIIDQVINAGTDLIISINASPFHLNKHKKRTQHICSQAQKHQRTIVYVNCVGGQDELVFDGGSFVADRQGNISHQADFFEQNLSLSTDKKKLKNADLDEKLTYDALVLATRDYIAKNGFKKAVLGLSGGVDSALSLAIAVDAIGAENVEVLLMPSIYTANISLVDAQAQANTMGVVYNNLPIQNLVELFIKTLSFLFSGKKRDITEENIQARIRGTLLMALSNKMGTILLATGNKSEYAVGYATLYGDMNGGFAPLKDVYKTMVYALAKYRNSISPVIPKRVIARPPSAELSENQTDQDTLPDYQLLDAILQLLVEKKLSSTAIISQGFEAKIVKDIAQMLLKNEYKRRQAAPGVKISDNAFGKERRYPITSKFAL